MKVALSVTTEEVTERTLMSGLGVIRKRRSSRLIHGVVGGGDTSSTIPSDLSSKSVVVDGECSGLIMFERLLVVCCVGILLCFWAVIKSYVFFVFLVGRVLLKHGLRGRHVR